MSFRAIAEALDIEYVPTDEEINEEEGEVEDSVETEVSANVEIAQSTENPDVVTEIFGPEQKIGHVEEDYDFTRRKMKSLITKGEDALDKLLSLAEEEESARVYEVASTMLKTMGDMTKEFFNLQKQNKELHQGSLGAVGVKSNFNIEKGVVFTGDSASVLKHLKEKKANKE